MAVARARSGCDGLARAMCWARMPRIGSPPGATSRPLPAPPRRSPQGSRRAPGNASPRGTDGTKGERLYDWAYCELADLDAGEYAEGETGLWTRGLLIRRSIADGQLAFFSTWCPAGTGIERLVTVEGHRWAIEDAFETAKTELGLDHNETRSWHGWHRHVSLAMLAFAMMAVVRHHANQLPPPKKTKGRVGRAAR